MNPTLTAGVTISDVTFDGQGFTPNLIAYLLAEEAMRILDDAEHEADALRDAMDLIWHRLNDAERKALNARGAMK